MTLCIKHFAKLTSHMYQQNNILAISNCGPLGIAFLLYLAQFLIVNIHRMSFSVPEIKVFDVRHINFIFLQRLKFLLVQFFVVRQ